MGHRFYLLIVPVSAVGLIGTAIGLRQGSSEAGVAAMALALAVGLACFIAARTFRDRAAWMAGFLFGLSLAAGFLLGCLGWRASPASAIAAIVTLIVGAVAGRNLRRFLLVLYTPLWVAAWLLILGLIGAWMVDGDAGWTGPLAIVAGIVLAALSAAWFARLPPDPQPVSAMDLYLLGLNLFLVIGVLQGEAALL